MKNTKSIRAARCPGRLPTGLLVVQPHAAQVASTADARGIVTAYTYDSQGRQTGVTYAKGTPQQTTTSTTYDALGNVATQTDQNGNTTTYSNNAVGQVYYTSTPYSTNSFATTDTSYNPLGMVSSRTDSDGNTTSYTYDNAGRELSQTQNASAGNATTSYTYDAAGNQTSMTDPNGNVTKFVYDGLGRRTETIYPDGTTASVTYDALGRKISETDQLGNTTTYTYDQLGELLSVTQPAVRDGNKNSPTYGQMVNPVTHYAYDSVGNEVRQTDPAGNTTTFAYNVLGQKTSRTLPMGQQEDWTYDADGNTLTHTDFNGHTTSYTYNAANQLVTQTPDPFFTNERPVSYTYTPTGQVATMTDGTGVTTYTYDLRGDLTNVQSPEGSITYTVDGNGNIISAKSGDANGENTVYTYTDNRLSQAAEIDTSGTTYAYDLNGNLITAYSPNGTTTSYAYDSLNRLTGEKVTNGPGTVIASYAYTLDADGRRIGVAETQLLPSGAVNTRNVSYVYDSLGRLIFETISGDTQGPDGTITYSYDLAGNRVGRTSTVAGVATSVSTYNANNELTTETDNGVATIYAYDSNGNTIQTSNGTTTTTFTYDSQNRLVKQNAGTAGEVDIAYDGAGTKVSETAGGVTTTYLVDTNNPTGYSQVAEELANGAVVRRYVLGLAVISETQQSNGTWATSYYGYDGHGSVRFLTSDSGAVTDTYTFDAFGNKLASIGSTPNQILYSGQYLDPGTGNYDLRARVYDENSGTFLTRDTYAGQLSAPLSSLPYVYCAENPASLVDESGNDFTLIDVAVSANIDSYLAATQGVGGQVVENSLLHGPEAGLAVTAVDDLSLLAGFAGGEIIGAIGGVAGEVASFTADRLGSVLGDMLSSLGSDSVQVFRVEAEDGANTRVIIADGSGDVAIRGTDKTLFLNFGQRERAVDFLLQRLRQGFADSTIKTFRVASSFLDELRATAVTEAEVAEDPGAPIRVDITNAPDQYGLRPPQIEALINSIVPGSGGVEYP